MKGRMITLVVLGVFLLGLSGCYTGKGTGNFKCAGGVCKADYNKPAKTDEAAIINTKALKQMLAAGSKVVVLDARSGKWDDGRRIPGAKALSSSASEEEAAALISSKDALVVTYCTNLKCPASAQLAKRLKELGYKNIIEYPYGIEGWVAEGNAIDKA